MIEARAKPEVVLLPGNMCDGRLWEGGDHVILKTIDSHGLKVSRVSFGDDASIEAMAKRALSASEGDLVPIGFSMGGIVALEMARQAPDRIRALGLIDTTSRADTRGPERLRQQRDVRNGELARVVTQELKPNYLAASNAVNDDLLALLADMAISLGPDVFIAQSEALRGRNDLTPLLRVLQMPVFVACGAQDALCPPALHRDMVAELANAQLHVIDDAGHILPLEQPEIFARRLCDFLTSTLGPKP